MLWESSLPEEMAFFFALLALYFDSLPKPRIAGCWPKMIANGYARR